MKIIQAIQRNEKKIIIIVAMTALLTYLGIFFFIPVIMAVSGSFYNWNPLAGTRDFIGLDNYIRMFESNLFWTSLLNTLYFASVAVIGKTVLGLLFSLLIFSIGKRMSFYRSIYFLPVITPTVAVAIIWKWIYHPRVGILNAFLAMFGIGGQTWLNDSTLAMPSILAMTVWKDVGYAIIIFLAALLNLPKPLYEASQIDGCNKFQTFKYITLPLLKPTFLFVFITSVISYFQTFTQIFVMTKGGPGTSTHTLSYLIYYEGFKNYNFGYASAIALILFILVMIVTVIQLKLLKEE